MCLTRPETMRSVCKVQIDPCEQAEPKIFDYVKAVLASMRVDSCTKEVKDCLTAEDRCGADYSNCIGLDIQSIKQMCPMDKLVGCQANGEAATWDTLDKVVQGIYLNADNALLDACQKVVNAKMTEICGGADGTCDAFADDVHMGAESLFKYTTGNGTFVIDGLLSFYNVKVKKTNSTDNDVKFGTYELDINDYYKNIEGISAAAGTDASKTSAAKERVLSTLRSVQGKINQKIAILTSDPKITMCINGRDMKQIRGRSAAGTETPNTRKLKTLKGVTVDLTNARFPHLLDSSIMLLINAGLEQADANYSKKYEELVAEVMEAQNDQRRSALCAAMASNPDKDLSTKYGNLFTTGKAGQGGSGYEIQLVIDGANLNKLLELQAEGKGTFVEYVKNADGSESMVSLLTTTANYSSESNTCNLTTMTEVCENMKDIYDEEHKDTTKCGSGGIEVLNVVSTCNGASGGGLLRIGGGGKKHETVDTKTFKGSYCSKFGKPVYTEKAIKM